MENNKRFLEFISKNNLPPCLPGDKLYWFDNVTGKIRRDEEGIKSIILNENWEWKIVDEDFREVVSVNENEYFCLTPEDAKVFRDELISIKYVILKSDTSGKIIIDSSSYSYFKSGIIDITSLELDDDYCSFILRNDSDVKKDMAIVFESYCFRFNEEGMAKQCYINSIDKKSKRILEDELGNEELE